MQRQWIKKNVDLALLKEEIENFFAMEGFSVKTELLGGHYRIVALPRYTHDVHGHIMVSISGNSNDFAIDFSSNEQDRSAILLGLLTTIVGGGRLLLKGLKSQESLEKLEKDFWSYIEGKITALTNSAKLH